MRRINRLFVALLVLFSILLPIGSALAFSASGTTVEGIDVSRYQLNIDFNAVAADGIEVVIIRSSQGTNYVDPYLEQNYARAKAAGLKIGFYHFVEATSVAEARAEARHFINTISGKEYDVRLVMDFEYYSGMSASQITQVAFAFMEEVESLIGAETGTSTVLYCSASSANYFSQAFADTYPYWVANYGVSAPRANDRWDTWVGWQYTSTGRVSGISGNVDRNQFTEDILLGEPGSHEGDGGSNSGNEGGGSGSGGGAEASHNYTVIQIDIEWGDTLWALSKKYGTTVDAIAKMNNIKNPDLIYAGAQLYIPATKNIEDSNLQDIYVVKRGDTLWGISQRFETSVCRLVGINEIKDADLIYPGQQIEFGWSYTA